MRAPSERRLLLVAAAKPGSFQAGGCRASRLGRFPGRKSSLPHQKGACRAQEPHERFRMKQPMISDCVSAKDARADFYTFSLTTFASMLPRARSLTRAHDYRTSCLAQLRSAGTGSTTTKCLFTHHRTKSLAQSPTAKVGRSGTAVPGCPSLQLPRAALHTGPAPRSLCCLVLRPWRSLANSLVT